MIYAICAMISDLVLTSSALLTYSVMVMGWRVFVIVHCDGTGPDHSDKGKDL